jgi:hypothetical protein
MLDWTQACGFFTDTLVIHSQNVSTKVAESPRYGRDGAGMAWHVDPFG